MGSDISITLDHHLSEIELPSILKKMVHLDGLFKEVAEVWKGRGDLPSFKWEDVTQSRTRPVRKYPAPAGFTLTIGKKSLRFHHVCRFWEFVENEIPRAVIRKFSCAAAQLFGSDGAIFSPDVEIGEMIPEWIEEGLTLNEIELRLSESGTPAQSLQELGVGGRFHFRDRFNDMKRLLDA